VDVFLLVLNFDTALCQEDGFELASVESPCWIIVCVQIQCCMGFAALDPEVGIVDVDVDVSFHLGESDED